MKPCVWRASHEPGWRDRYRVTEIAPADTTLRDDSWRFAADARSRARRSQMISGRMLMPMPQTAPGC